MLKTSIVRISREENARFLPPWKMRDFSFKASNLGNLRDKQQGGVDTENPQKWLQTPSFGLHNRNVNASCCWLKILQIDCSVGENSNAAMKTASAKLQ